MPSRRTPKRTAREEIRQQSRAAYQELILEAAERVFAERGYAGTRMSDIAAEAAVATGTLYNYFTGKEEVFRSLVELRSREFLEGMEAVYAECTQPVARIEALLRFVFEYLEEHADAYASLLELGALCEPSVGSAVADGSAQSVAVFERALTAAARAGKLERGCPDPADIAVMLTGAMKGLSAAWLTSGRSWSLADKADAIIRTFLRGIAK